jgi:uncharacterized protein YndB with AHSA1/START domain
MELKFQVQIKVQKPVKDVFDAVYDPEKLSAYFTNGGASAPMDANTTVQWAFEDTPGEPIGPFPVEVKNVVPNERIEFEWEGSKGRNTRVVFDFTKTGDEETLVQVAECGWQENQEELDRSYMNCMGWSHMIVALKAYAEYGINLRKGAYSGLYKPSEMKAEA